MMRKFSKSVLMLSLVASLVLTACNAGNTNNDIPKSTSFNLMRYKNLLSYKPKINNQKINFIVNKSEPITTNGNQQVFTLTHGVTLTSLRFAFYSSNDCSGSTNWTKDINGATPFYSGEYTTSNQSNYALCNIYGGVSSGGCSQEFNETNSIQITYTTNIGTLRTQCVVGKIGDDSNQSNITFCANSNECGFTKPISVEAMNPLSPYLGWMKGNLSNGNQSAVYGVKGISDINNTPGGRQGSSGWVGRDGNLWLFGGNSLNDLWKYNPATNQWTWVNGSNFDYPEPVFGIKGVADINNTPSMNTFSTNFTDNSGNFWFFGGYQENSEQSSGLSNQLWKYDPLINEWTWVGGDNDEYGNKPGIYGTQGIYNEANYPGARINSASWVDKSGNFWLFGGIGYANNDNRGSLGDLWTYNPSTDQWIWVKGDNVINQDGVYGEKGVASLSNHPGSRNSASSWIDQSGNLWLFGGLKFDGQNNVGNFNDLWKYDPSSNMWTWENGSNLMNQSGVYGIKGQPNTNNTPGSRFGAANWVDKSGNLWLFGGWNNSDTILDFNDIWEYNIKSNTWTWMSGSNTTGSLGNSGIQGVLSEANSIGVRASPVTWIDSSNNFWLYGGSGLSGGVSEGLSDLWKIVIPKDENQ